MNFNFSIRELSNKIRVVSIPRPHTDLVVVKIYIKVGSVNDRTLYGLTHFLEHMLFQNRVINHNIFYEIERHGGEINAATYKDNMTVYISVLKKYFYQTLNYSLNMLFNFNITEENVENERKVIIQEILSYINVPSAMWDLFSAYYWSEGAIRFPIRGNIESVSQISLQDLKEHYRNYFVPNNIVISCAGDFEEKELINNLESYYKNHIFSTPTNINFDKVNVVMDKEYMRVERNLSLSHIFTAFPSALYGNKDLVPLNLISKLLAGGSYSRLYQKLREEEGAVYAIESKLIAYSQVSSFLIYTKCSLENEEKVINSINNEVNDLKQHLISNQELDFLHMQYKGNIIRKFETLLSLCSALGIELLLTNNITSFESAEDYYINIDRKKILQIANEYLTEPKVIVIGKSSKGD